MVINSPGKPGTLYSEDGGVMGRLVDLMNSQPTA